MCDISGLLSTMQAFLVLWWHYEIQFQTGNIPIERKVVSNSSSNSKRGGLMECFELPWYCILCYQLKKTHHLYTLLEFTSLIEWRVKVSAFYAGAIELDSYNSKKSLMIETSYKDGAWLNLFIMNMQIYQFIYHHVCLPTKKQQ